MALLNSVTVPLFLPRVFSLGLSLPRVGNGGGKRQFVTPGHSSDPGGNLGKRVRLTRKTRPGVSSHVHSGAGASNAEAMEKIAHPSSEGVGG